MSTTPRAAATTYLASWKAGDFATQLLSPDPRLELR